MSGVIERVHDAIAAALAGDAVFTAALTDIVPSGGCGLVRVPPVVRSMRPTAEVLQMHQGQVPVWIIEAAPLTAGPVGNLSDDDSGLVMGGYQQSFELLIALGLVWTQQDRDAAYLQRLRIPEALVKLCLRQLDFGVDGCAAIYVNEVDPDPGLKHPNQNLLVSLSANIVITRN